MGRTAWAREEFALLEGTRWAGRGARHRRYLRVKGARDLNRRELAVLRELVPWRDAVAGSARPRDLSRARQRAAARHRAHAAADEGGAGEDQGNAARRQKYMEMRKIEVG